MNLFSKVKGIPVYICGIEVSFSENSKPSNIDGWQPFYNTLFDNYDFNKKYVSIGSIYFTEKSEEISAGTLYKQKLDFKFPNYDEYRSERIELLKKAKFIKINLTNGKNFILGRNDFNQNAKPKFIFNSNQSLSEIEIQTISMFPTGYGVLNTVGFPYLLPINL